jgi:cysteine desulfurase
MPSVQTIYLDHNATSPLLPEVSAAMAECYAAGYANPASQHQVGRRARQALEDAREGIAAILGADLASAAPDALIFTSGGTEANNLAIFGLAGEQPCRIAISAIEHPSVAEPAKELRRRGWQVDVLPVTPEGVLSVGDSLRESRQLAERVDHISVMLGNNETGAIQPIAGLAAICRETGTLLHTDAVQAVGKVPVNFRQLGVAAMTVAAHKFGGPRGIGALVLRHGVALRPQLRGGFQQAGLRPGTEDVALAVGMHAALRLWQREGPERTRRLTELRDRLERALRLGWPGLVVHAAEAERLPHTSCVAFPGLNRQALVIALDLAGVACSTGSACASGSSDPSPTLVAMGCEKQALEGSIRLSLGVASTAAEIDEASRRILAVCNDLNRQSLAGKFAAQPRPTG